MDASIAVALLFLASTGVTFMLILRRPFLSIRLGNRQVRLETYFLGALMGPALILAFGLLSMDQAVEGVRGGAGVDALGILVLFLSMVFLSIFLDITGFFEYCARVALRFAGSDGVRLFFALYATVAFLTVFTSNDIVVLTMTPFIFHFTRSAGVDPVPYLVSGFFAANTWSMALFIGNPTNILLASAFGLGFGEYLLWMALPTLAAGAVNLALLYVVFRRRIAARLPPRAPMDPRDAITDAPGAVMGLALLVSCIVALSAAPRLGLEMWKVSLAFALALVVTLLARESWASLHRGSVDARAVRSLASSVGRMPWPVVPFVLSLFVTVEALRVYGVTGWLGEGFAGMAGGSHAASVLLYGVSSALTANVLNNIPMTVAYVSVLGSAPADGRMALVFAAVAGSNLGANLTPLGSLAGIMWLGILRGKGLEMSTREFVRYGLLVTPLALLSSLAALALVAAVL